MLPAVVVLAVTLRPMPPALTVVRVSVPLSAASVIAPSFVVALVTVSAPLLRMSIAPRPVTFAEVSVVIVVSKLIPVPAVAVRLDAVTLFAAPLASMIAPAAFSVTTSGAVTTPSTTLPLVVVLSVTSAPTPAAVTVPIVRSPPVALRVMLPLTVVALVTVRAPLLRMSMAPVPVTFAEVRVVIVVSRSMPVPAVTVRLEAVTLFVTPFASVIDPTAVSDTWSPAAETEPTAMFPAVVVLAVTLRPMPPALTVVRVSVPLSAAKVIAPSVVVALVTVSAPLLRMSIAPRPVTFADVRVVIVVPRLRPVPAVAVRLEAVTLFAVPLASMIAPAAFSVTTSGAVTTPSTMLPLVVVVRATSAPAPAAVTVPIVRSPLAAFRVMLPLAVVALVTASAPVLLMSIAPAPVTFAEVSVAMVVSRLMPLPAVAARLAAVTLFATPFASVIAPAAFSVTTSGAVTTPSTMLPLVVVLSVTSAPAPAAVTVPIVRSPLVALRVMLPLAVVALVTASAPLLRMSIAPVPVTFADVSVVMAVSRSIPVPAVAVRLEAVTLFVAPFASVIDPTAVSDTWSPVAETLPTAMFPAVVVLAVTLRPVPPALTVVRVSVPLLAASVIAPSFVVALVTVSAPLLRMSMAPVPVTLAEVSVVIVVSKLIPVPAVAVKLEAVTLFAAPLASMIAPAAFSVTTSGAVTTPSTTLPLVV